MAPTVYRSDVVAVEHRHSVRASGFDENDDERPSMDAIDRYLGRVKAVVISLIGTVPAEYLDTAQHLIDHGELAEDLCCLA